MKLSEFEPICGVYIIKSGLEKSAYIGQSRNVEVRLAQHYKALAEGRHPCPELQKDFNLHGSEAFDCSLIHGCKPKDLLKKELYYINLFLANGWRLYNQIEGGFVTDTDDP